VGGRSRAPAGEGEFVARIAVAVDPGTASDFGEFFRVRVEEGVRRRVTDSSDYRYLPAREFERASDRDVDARRLESER